MVLVALGHTDGTVQEGVAPVGRRGQRASQTVRLAVSLVHDVHAHRVAQLIPARTVGIVGQSHGIDVGVLHQAQVLQHALLGHYTGGIRVVLVAVDAAYLDGVAVDEQLTVLDADVAKTYLLRHALDGSPVAVLQFQQQRIEIRTLDAPQPWVVDAQLHAVELAIAALGVPFVHARSLVLEVEDFVCCD